MSKLNRRQSLALIATGGLAAGQANAKPKVFDVHDYGAKGDGQTLDTQAVQKAIDAAAKAGGQVKLRTGKTYLLSPVELKGGIDFHLEGTAEIMVSVNPDDYGTPADSGTGTAASASLQAVLHASGADKLTLSGTGTINGRSPEFMERYDDVGEWWVPKKFRPKLVVLENCKDLTIRDITLKQAPSWTVHLLGCQRVKIDHISIHNAPDVPNCDGIDPDHCQDVDIRNCHIVCGDDAIVIKATKGHDDYGPSRNITVRDCVLETQDSGVKIGTETTQDIHDILFERCTVVNGCRGLCIQLRDAGSVYNVIFRDITFTSRYFSAPWWGRGEAISFTAIPRTPGGAIGTIHDILVQNVSGKAENSIRVNGSAQSRIRDVTLDNVKVTFDRWTKYQGGVYDNRPTTAMDGIETHATVGISLRHADNISLKNCVVEWGKNVPDYFSHALQAEDVTGLKNNGFKGNGAHPDKDQAIVTG